RRGRHLGQHRAGFRAFAPPPGVLLGSRRFRNDPRPARSVLRQEVGRRRRAVPVALSTALAAGSFLGLRIAGGSVTPHSQWVRAGLVDAMTVSGSAAPDRTDRDRQVEDWFKTPVNELTSAPRTTVATPGALVPTTLPAYRSSPFERVPQTTVTTGALV